MSTNQFEQAIGHVFANRALLKTALTHRSHGVPHNERLEFLGDSILDAVIARQLFARFAELPEGDLSRLRANLVCQESLHQLALSLSLGRLLYLGEGELKSGGAQRASILADALEATFGAVWLDAGFDAASAVIVKVYAEKLAAIAPGGSGHKDPKTRLQEYLQARHLPLPKYVLLATEGRAHAQSFQIRCEIEALHIRAEGRGVSRRAAEQMAAETALKGFS